MPFKSEKQRRYMHANHPEIAERWEAEAKRMDEEAVQKKKPKKAKKKKD